ncbi:MAG: 7-cyano-7-deazaguanine synthase [Spartobacteria bacterium]
MKRAVILLSGGLDSATTLAIAIAQGFETHALSFDYGQRHKIELEAAQRVAKSLGAKTHRVAKIDNGAGGSRATWTGKPARVDEPGGESINHIFAGSALTDDVDVPKSRSDAEIAHGIPITYVPARNTIFLAHALAYAEILNASDIFIGVNALDYSGYPDCRPEFIRAFEQMANLATKIGVEGSRLKIHTPLIDMTKADIIRKAQELHVDLALTHSCYDPTQDGRACGECDSCQLRRKGFAEAGVEDPIQYPNP